MTYEITIFLDFLYNRVYAQTKKIENFSKTHPVFENFVLEIPKYFGFLYKFWNGIFFSKIFLKGTNRRFICNK